MTKHRLIGEWVEIYDQCLTDGPPRARAHEVHLFINRCRAIDRPDGSRRVTRERDSMGFTGVSVAEVEARVREYYDQPGRRLLVPGVELNGPTDIYQRSTYLKQSVLDGTDPIYVQRESGE